MAERLVSQHYDVLTAIKWMDHLAAEGSRLSRIQGVARHCSSASDPIRCVFNFAYSAAVFYEVAQDYQRTQTVGNILRTKQTNCYGYCVLMAAVFKAMGKSVVYVPCGASFSEIYHVYLKIDGICLDCTLGQPLEGATFNNRSPQGQYNDCPVIPYSLPIDSTMITVMNKNRGAMKRSSTIRNLPLNEKIYSRPGTTTQFMNKIDPATAQAIADKLPEIVAAGKDALDYIKNLIVGIFGDPCKRGCDFRHALDRAMRRACKAKCEADADFEAQQAYEYALSLMTSEQRANVTRAGISVGTEELLLLGGAAALIYFLR